jgi:hypothetical protein
MKCDWCDSANAKLVCQKLKLVLCLPCFGKYLGVWDADTQVQQAFINEWNLITTSAAVSSNAAEKEGI